MKKFQSLLRKKLSLRVFQKTSSYDLAISNYLSNKINEVPDINLISDVPKVLKLDLNQVKELRYGENPHQKASLYGNFFDHYEKLHGKELSYNNYNDIFSALSIIKSIKKGSGTVIIKHANPCGVSVKKDSLNSFKNAYSCDPSSAFGGVIACNYKISKKIALEITKNFLEVILASGFDNDSLKILKKKALLLKSQRFV